jgi:hypothetical protein
MVYAARDSSGELGDSELPQSYQVIVVGLTPFCGNSVSHHGCSELLVRFFSKEYKVFGYWCSD